MYKVFTTTHCNIHCMCDIIAALRKLQIDDKIMGLQILEMLFISKHPFHPQ